MQSTNNAATTNSNSTVNYFAALAAFSIIWVILAYLSKYTTGAIPGISFYLPILLIFTVPLLFNRNQVMVIGLLGGVIGVNYLIGGGFGGALVTIVFTLGVMMLGMYYLAPRSTAEMKRPMDWFTYIVLTVVLLAVGETLALASEASPNLTSAWNAASPILVGGIILAVINCILLRTLTPAFKTSGLYKSEAPSSHVAVPAITNQTSATTAKTTQ